MSLGKALAVGSVGLVVSLGALAGEAVAEDKAPAPKLDEAPIIKLSEELRSPRSTGKWKEVGVDGGKSRISDVSRAKVSERAVPASAVVGEQSVSVDWRRLQREMNQRFGDLEECRNKVARAEKVPVEDLRAGLVVLRWTILPTGRTAATTVYQQRETELELMRCIRARMETWQFTPPAGNPIVIEQTYDFQAALAAAARQATVAPAESPIAAPPASDKAK
jgi:hypothetical protein